MVFTFPYFIPKLIYFFCFRLLIWPCALGTNLLVELSSLFWNVLLCLYWLTLFIYFLSLNIDNIFSFVSSSCVTKLICVFFFHLFISFVSCVFYLSSSFSVSLFVHLSSFLIQVLHSSSDFFFIRVGSILSLISFSPGKMNSFSSVMSVGI